MRIRIPPAAVVVAVACSAVTGPLAAGQPAAGPSQDVKPYTERVEVHRVLLDVRVTDGLGQPLEDLGKRDFVVRIDGKAAPVESATWVTGALRSDGFMTTLDGSSAATTMPIVEGRLLVFLIQKDLEPSRIIGLMRLLVDARPFFTAFTPRDRLAVLSFDSRLRIWTDFTNDLESVRAIMRDGILMSEPAAPVESEAPSLVAGLSPRGVKRASTLEEALALVGHALEPLPGAKSVIIFGHGFGRLGLSGVDLAPDYAEARRSLRAARASVFCLDVTQADYHSLEVGLEQVAEDTGGFFERTHLFPKQALNRLAGTLAGHYVLLVERPAVRKGVHKVDVSVPHRGATVLVRDFVD